MTIWSSIYSTPPRFLHVEAGQVRLEARPSGQPAFVQSCSAEAFLSGELHHEVRVAFDVLTLAEAIAVLRFSRLPEAQRPQPTDHSPLKGRPTSPRTFGESGRGKLSTLVWFHGRTVIVSPVEQPRVTLRLEDVSRDGLSSVHRAALGDKHADAVEKAARALEPMPCMCGTGCQTMDEHGSLQPLSYCKVPNIPVDHVASTGRCTVCGRWWTFEEISAFRYTPQRRVQEFKP